MPLCLSPLILSPKSRWGYRRLRTRPHRTYVHQHLALRCFGARLKLVSELARTGVFPYLFPNLHFRAGPNRRISKPISEPGFANRPEQAYFRTYFRTCICEPAQAGLFPNLFPNRYLRTGPKRLSSEPISEPVFANRPKTADFRTYFRTGICEPAYLRTYFGTCHF